MPKLLVRLRESAPGLHVDLVEAEPPEAAAVLRAGEVDLAVTFAYAGQGFGGDVVTEHLGWDALHLVEGTAHAAVVGRTKTKNGGVEPDALGALADARWVAGCERCRTGLVDLCESVGVSPRIDFASDDVVAVQALVAAGFGVTLLPDLALRAHRDAGVATQPMRGAGRELQVATFGAMPRPAAVEEVVQTLLELMREGAFAY